MMENFDYYDMMSAESHEKYFTKICREGWGYSDMFRLRWRSFHCPQLLD